MDILILSHSEDPHVVFLQPALKKRGVDAARLNTDELFLSEGFTYFSDREQILRLGDGEKISCANIKSIWNRRPQTPKISHLVSDSGVRTFCEREAESGMFGFLHSLGVPWVNHPEKNAMAKHKVLQMQLARRIGFTIPDTCISNSSADVSEFMRNHPGGVVYKPLTWGVAYPDRNEFGVAIPTSVVTMNNEFLRGVPLTLGIYQERLLKKSEIRVTIFGSKLFAVEIDVSEIQQVDIRSSIPHLQHSVIQLPIEIETACRKMTDQFGLLYGAIDLVLAENGSYYFLEINPNGQWAWLEKKTGLPMSEALVDLLLNPHS